LLLCVYLGFIFCAFFRVNLNHFVVLVLFAIVVSGLVCSVLSEEIGCEERFRIRNDLFCVEWDGSICHFTSNALTIDMQNIGTMIRVNKQRDSDIERP